jgi:hypothetical protein
VLDDVERRRFLVQPAREGAVPFLVRALHVELDERARQLLFLPRRRRFTGPQPHQNVLPPRRLARVESDRFHDPVALVENAEHGNALRHRRHSGLATRRSRSGLNRPTLLLLLLLPAPAGGERQREQQWCGDRSHFYSGIQGS